jgi:hypothetical protein
MNVKGQGEKIGLYRFKSTDGGGGFWLFQRRGAAKKALSALVLRQEFGTACAERKI